MQNTRSSPNTANPSLPQSPYSIIQCSATPKGCPRYERYTLADHGALTVEMTHRAPASLTSCFPLHFQGLCSSLVPGLCLVAG